MSAAISHVALALAVLALADAALRAASRVGLAGLERAVAAVVLATSFAVLLPLALGLVALGTSPFALGAGTALAWVVARRLLPAPELGAGAELASWWRALPRAGRVAAAAAAGVGAAWLVWHLRYPAIGFDSALYHYGDVAGWMVNGRPGSELELSYEIPYVAYPQTDEVAQTWAVGFARSWVPFSLWNPFLAVVLAAAGWRTLRTLAVPRPAAGLAVACVLAPPVVARQLSEAQTDLPALTWVACAAALALAARRVPGALPLSLLAAGLALGTKASVAPVLVVALAAGAWTARAHLRRLVPWLAAAAAGAVAIGGVWYVRNLVRFGSPFWPFAPGPFGDEAPRFFRLVDDTFLERPRATLDGRLHRYVDELGGLWLVLAGIPLALVAAVVTRERALRRALVVSAGAAALGVAAWSTAWSTGLQDAAGLAGYDGWPLSSLRYLLPALATAATCVALLARLGRAGAVVAYALLGTALAWSLAETATLGMPSFPRATTLLAGAALGLVALAAAEGLSRAARGRRRGAQRAEPASAAGRGAPRARVAAAVAAAVAAGLLASLAAPGYLERYTRTPQATAPGAEVVAWMLDRPGFEDGDVRVAFASHAVLAPMAGDDFAHPLELVPRDGPCSAIRAEVQKGPVAVTSPGYFAGVVGVDGYAAPRCLAGLTPAYDDGTWRVYEPASRSAARSRGGRSPAPMTRTSGSGTMKRPPPSR